jgi:transcriptional regulator with XRE-family HTH domain
MKFQRPEIDIPSAAYNAGELSVDIGTNVFAARTKKGWTQLQLAKELKTLQPSIARVENGNTVPSLNFLLRIAKALGTGLVAPTFELLLSNSNVKTSVESSSSTRYQAFTGTATPVSSPYLMKLNTI